MSEGRRQTARSIRTRQVTKFEQGLQQLHDNLSLPRRMKHYDRVVEAVGRLKERHPGLARHYAIQVHRGDGDKAKAVIFTRKASFDESDDLLGACILRTSHTDWDLETILRTYHRLTDIEAVFRELKGELGLRPIWHTREDRIQAHLFIAVLAYHAVQLIRTRFARTGHGAALAEHSSKTAPLDAHYYHVADGPRRTDRDPSGRSCDRRTG